MNYLLDKKNKRNRYLKILFGAIIFILIFLFRASIGSGLGYLTHGIFRPVLGSGSRVGDKIISIKTYFSSKNSLYQENLNLKSQIDASAADRANYDSVVKENNDLKEILNRKNAAVPMTLAAILSKPNQSPYDTLLIDVGSDAGIIAGDRVYAYGDVPIGRVEEVYSKSAKVVLFSTSGEKTQVIISRKNVFIDLVGRGGGNFEMVLPRDMVLWKDDQVVLPGIAPQVVATVQTVITDPRESFQKALLVSPVNIQELKFVEVQK